MYVCLYVPILLSCMLMSHILIYNTCHQGIQNIYIHTHTHILTSHIQPIANRVAQHLEIISKDFQFSTRRTRILMRFNINYLVQIVNSVGRFLVRWKRFGQHLEMLCHPICNRLYDHANVYSCIYVEYVDT